MMLILALAISGILNLEEPLEHCLSLFRSAELPPFITAEHLPGKPKVLWLRAIASVYEGAERGVTAETGRLHGEKV